MLRRIKMLQKFKCQKLRNENIQKEPNIYSVNQRRDDYRVKQLT